VAMGASASTPSLSSVKELPQAEPHLLPLDAVKTLARSSFVVLYAVVNGRWLPLRPDQSTRDKRLLGIVKVGSRLVPSEELGEECRLLVHTPRPGDLSEVYLRSASRHDVDLRFLLFVNGRLCERRGWSAGQAGAWERLAVTPTRFMGSTHAFHLRSHETREAVCFDEANGCFVRCDPGDHIHKAVFALATFQESMIPTYYDLPPAVDIPHQRSCPEGDSLWQDAASVGGKSATWFGPLRRSSVGPRRSVMESAVETPRKGEEDWHFLSTQGSRPSAGARPSAAGRAGAPPPRPSTNANPATSASFAEGSGDQSGGVPSFVLLDSTVVTTTGEPCTHSKVVKGTTRCETLRFHVNEDLVELVRTERVTMGVYSKASSMVLGSFPKSGKVYEYHMPEKHVPWYAPKGRWQVQVVYTAANKEGELSTTSGEFSIC